MTRPALALAALALTTLAACGPSDPSTVESPPATGPATSTPPAASGSATATPTAGGPSCPAAPPLPAGATLVTATVAGGKVTTEHDVWTVKMGTAVRVAVTADVRDEVHVHTFEKKQATAPGCPTAIDFTANVPGTHEVELHDAHLDLFKLRVTG